MSNIKRIIIFCCFIIVVSCVDKPQFLTADFSSGEFSINEAELIEGMPLFFKTNIYDISFFIIKKNGHISSYLNACQKCYSSKKGFSVEKDHIVCRVCDIRYPMNALDVGIGSCFPIVLRGFTKDGRYIIKKDEVIKGKAYF